MKNLKNENLWTLKTANSLLVQKIKKPEFQKYMELTIQEDL